MLGFEDDEIMLTREMVERIADLIREVRPDVLVTHHPYEMGGLNMHATTGQAVVCGWQKAGGTGRGQQKSHTASAVFFMNPMATANNSLGYGSTARIHLLVDITDVVDKKVQAMDMIGSQYYSGAYARKVLEYGEGNLGQGAGVAYAEAFQRFLPPVRYTLNVSDADLRRAAEPLQETMGRRSEIVAGLMPLPPGQEFTSKFRFSKDMYDT